MYIEVRKRLFWSVKIVATGNNEITFTSEAFFSKSNAYRAARRASKILNIPIKD